MMTTVVIDHNRHPNSHHCAHKVDTGQPVAFSTIMIQTAIFEIPWGSLLGLRAPICRPVFLNTFMSSRSPAAAAAAADANARISWCVLS